MVQCRLLDMTDRQHDYIIISDVNKNLQGPNMHLCAKFGCSSPDFFF